MSKAVSSQISNDTVTASQLWFVAPRQVEIRETQLPPLSADTVLVQTQYSAISAGSELLVYQGLLPDAMALDSSLESLQQQSNYPLQYGYACVGKVIAVGEGVEASWIGRQVFSFQPHASHFCAAPDQLIEVPADISARDAVFLPNMETAVNLVQDGQPLLGEQVVVLGQGIVGLLLTAILSRFPLAELVAIETRPERQELARKLGADSVLEPDAAGPWQQQSSPDGADLVFEVSGQPEALNLAINLSGYTSRVVIGSWYGSKTAAVQLGGEAHRNRLQMITSQVSTLAPKLSGRWDKQRRFELAWELLRQIKPEQLISHTEPLRNAGQLYASLEKQQPGLVQAVFEYSI